jgi:hypothetical protein
MGQRERDPCAKFPIREAEENTRNAGPWRGGGGESSHGGGNDLERKKAYCLYCVKPVSELAVRLSLVDEPEIFR